MEKLHASSDSHRHGLLAKCVLLDHENPETFALLHQQYIDRINPSDGIEITLVEDLAATIWRQRRLWRIERNLLSEAMQKRPEAAGNRLAGAFSDLSRGPELILLDRQESRLHRSFHRTLKNIQLLRQIELPNEPNSEELDLESAIYPTTSEPENSAVSATATGGADTPTGGTGTRTSATETGGADFSLLPTGPAVPPQNSKLPNEPNSPEPIAKSALYPQASIAFRRRSPHLIQKCFGQNAWPKHYDGEVKLTIELDREEDGRWIAEALELPGVMCYGLTREEAITNVERLAIDVVADRVAHGELPSSSLGLAFTIPDELLAR